MIIKLPNFLRFRKVNGMSNGTRVNYTVELFDKKTNEAGPVYTGKVYIMDGVPPEAIAQQIHRTHKVDLDKYKTDFTLHNFAFGNKSVYDNIVKHNPRKNDSKK